MTLANRAHPRGAKCGCVMPNTHTVSRRVFRRNLALAAVCISGVHVSLWLIRLGNLHVVPVPYVRCCSVDSEVSA